MREYSVAVDSLGYAYVAGLTTSDQSTFLVLGGTTGVNVRTDH